MRVRETEELDEELKELEQNLKRLRIEYEQFFLGNMKREPIGLRAKVQKSITRLVNEPPRNSAQKFRFNTLNSRFQVYRQLWGRTLREIESGTYKPHRFRMRPPEAETGPEPGRDSAPGAGPRSSFDKLYDALVVARRQTGESGPAIGPDGLRQVVRKQMEAIRERYGPGAKVRFKVVVEDNRAKVKASVKS